ncbi:DNA adenine methylase, partial [Noviherbaspirillum sp.]|uniref:DNA adenine methylase n=1 Tax=Noviherbaspirillum sp. TaxID=1926288 RepID=UPI002FE36A7D
MPDDTALDRQHKRLAHLKERGLKRVTLLVHTSNEATLELLRAHFSNPESAEALNDLHSTISSRLSAHNISKVRQLSPFRYAGGKTWLVPEVRRWIESLKFRPRVLVEPFAGGAIVGLTAAVENLADKVVICELDKDVAAVWKVIFGRSDTDAAWLYSQIEQANLTEAFARAIIESEPKATKERAFRTIIKNRVQRGGILAPGAGLIKAGENGKGLLSRWYPETLVKRMQTLR